MLYGDFLQIFYKSLSSNARDASANLKSDRLLGSRIRARLATEYASREDLMACLDHLLTGAGNASLMTPGLRQTLCDHSAGNYRVLTTMAAELLAAAAQRDLPQLDEKLYLDVFSPPTKPAPRRASAR